MLLRAAGGSLLIGRSSRYRQMEGGRGRECGGRQRLSDAGQIVAHVENSLIDTTGRTGECLPLLVRTATCDANQLGDECHGLASKKHDSGGSISVLRRRAEPDIYNWVQDIPAGFRHGRHWVKIIERIDEKVLEQTARRCRERNIIIPTFAQQKDPTTIPAGIREKLANVGLWDVDPLNLFRITWKNEPVERGGGFNDGNWIEFPPELTGVDARIVGVVGKWFPTGGAQGGGRLRLPGAATGVGAVRSDVAEGGMAEHG